MTTSNAPSPTSAASPQTRSHVRHDQHSHAPGQPRPTDDRPSLPQHQPERQQPASLTSARQQLHQHPIHAYNHPRSKKHPYTTPLVKRLPRPSPPAPHPAQTPHSRGVN
jgi:hypothetical protein